LNSQNVSQKLNKKLAFVDTFFVTPKILRDQVLLILTISSGEKFQSNY